MKYFIGYDLGSSFIKASLVNAETGECVAQSKYPEEEMEMITHEAGWAEQDPNIWWNHICTLTQQLLASSKVDKTAIYGLGISYQMHGLVVVDSDGNALRPSIIWCDSRAVAYGNNLFEKIGEEKCTAHLLNSPGNFTFSKLLWVKENEPEIFAKTYKLLLPGDFIALKMTGQFTTTASGLSEGIMWDFKKNKPATWLFEAENVSTNLLPEVVDTFSSQGQLTVKAAKELGLNQGVSVLYRAGDQPNNALSLGVLEPGQIAATGGTSGVVYAVTQANTTKETLRVNNFVHVNHTAAYNRIGKLLNINGAGIAYSWIRKNTKGSAIDYPTMNQLASEVSVGAQGLVSIPFGNGAERMLNNTDTGAAIYNINYNIHGQSHLYRSFLEGIAFSFIYGMEILAGDGVDFSLIRSGNDNLFQAEIFAQTIANVMNVTIEIVETTGSTGAAKAAAFAAGAYPSLAKAFEFNSIINTIKPSTQTEAYITAYNKWKLILETKHK